MVIPLSGNYLCIPKDLLGNRCWIFVQYPSNLLKVAPLQEFLLDIESIGECEVFSWLSDFLSHSQSFPADR